MSGTIIDSNVLLDIILNDQQFGKWSDIQLTDAIYRGLVIINPIIYAELAPAFSTNRELDVWVKPSVFVRAELPYDAAWITAEAFKKYRRAGGIRPSPLPDFYIGACRNHELDTRYA